MKQRLQGIAAELLKIANEMEALQVEAEEQKTVTFQITSAIRIGNIEIKAFGLDKDGNPISLIRIIRG